MTSYNQLDLLRGTLTGASNIRMWAGSAVRRKNQRCYQYHTFQYQWKIQCGILGQLDHRS